MKKKRILAFLLSACLVLAPVMSASASGLEGVGGADPSGASGASVETLAEPSAEALSETSPESGIATVSGEEIASNADGAGITEDFTSATGTWGFSGDLESAVSIGDKNGNKYLKVAGTKLATQTATKTLEGVPENLGSAEISYTLLNNGLTSDSSSARAGLSLMNGPVEVVSVYMSDGRVGGSKENTSTKIYYSVQGMTPALLTSVSKGANDTAEIPVAIQINFAAHTADIAVGGKTQTVTLNPAAASVTALMLNMAGGNGKERTYDLDIGIDDFSMTYDENGAVEQALYIQKLASLEAKEATKADYDKDFADVHPASVEATLSDGTTKELQIDAASWTSDKAVVADDVGTYTWTADVVLPDDNSVVNTLNLKASYTMNYKSDFLETDIDSLIMPDPKTATKEQWENKTYEHPKQVVAKLVNGSTILVDIDQDTWTCPDFDVEKKGAYVWTADIKAPEGNRNHRGLKVSYTMNYYGTYVSTHDYENDFTFGVNDWGVWGREVESGSWSGGYGFEFKTENGNTYLLATQNDSGKGRGSRVDLPNDIIKGATVQFDWKPVTVKNGQTNISFVSPAIWQNYFTIIVDSNGAIKYYTEPDYTGSNASKPADCNGFTGEIKAASPTDTGITGMIGKWFTVKLVFDYIEHTAEISVTKAGENTPAYTAKDIPIFGLANGVSSMVMRKPGSCASSVNALDNIFIDHVKFGEMDIVAIEQPADINMTSAEWADHHHPTEVTAKLGSGEKVQVPVGEWTSEPAFDENLETTYAWKAELIPGQYTNYFNLSAAYKMSYTKKPYVTRVNNPSTLELEFGQEWNGSMPATATVILSSGEIVTDAPVGEWTAIRAFDAANQGVYVYGAKLTEDDRYVIKPGVACEYHEAQTRDNLKDLMTYDEDLYDYDVFYRISYFESNNHYNEYVRSMENLDRGVTAVPSGNGILVSWRLRVEEYGTGIQFNVLRNGTKINSEPISTKTNYLDAEGKAGDKYTVQVIKDGKTVDDGTATALAQNYMSIKVQKPDPQPDFSGTLNSYTLNDAGVADVDGDGEYEIVVKWYPSDAFDSGVPGGPSAPTLFDFYELDGTPLWRLNMGLEMPSGAHFNQFMLYDLNEDGKAEFFIKASDGTVSYKPNAAGKFEMTTANEVSYVGDRSVVPGTNITSSGHVGVNTNEYVVAFEGATGKLISQIDYINQSDANLDWGNSSGKDDGGNRSARYNIALAYLPAAANDPGCTTTVPAVLLNRGYYDRTTVAAYILTDNGLELRWNFVAPNGTELASKGNHNVSTGDMDNDGFDELVIGALAIDHDGQMLWVKDGKDGQDFQGHSDAIHLTAMNPEKPTQLYVFTPSEEGEATLNGTLSNAANGSRINGTWSATGDIGRGVAANITPNAGFEYWINKPGNEAGADGAIYNFDGTVLASVPPTKMSTNWRLYWDGDLLSELGDGRNSGTGGTDQAVYKYDWENNELNQIEVLWGTHTNNSTKNNPSLTADLFGDWREEIMVPSKDDTELRIYMTGYETDYMIYSLMQDPVYRNAVANQNTSYNQPPHLGFYLGEDNADVVRNMGLTTPNIRYTTVDTPDPTPTPVPTPEPTTEPTTAPTTEPTTEPTTAPTTEPTTAPTTEPTTTPTTEPTTTPTTEPTTTPTTKPTTAPTPVPDTNDEKVDNAVRELDKVKQETEPAKILDAVKQIFNDLKEAVTGSSSEKQEKLAETVVKSLGSLKELEEKLIAENGKKVTVDDSAVVPTVEIQNTEFNAPSGLESKIVIEPDNTKTKPADLDVDSVAVFSFSLLTKTSGSGWVKQPTMQFTVPLYVTLDVPAEIDTSNGVLIFHIADGSNVWEALGEGILSADGKKVSFVAGSFSSYAVASKAGTQAPAPDDDNDDDDDNDSDTGSEQKTAAPKTGDYMNSAATVWVVVLAMAGIGTAAVIRRRKESE